VGGETLNELFVAEERVHIVGFGKKIAAPAIEHRQFWERCEVFCLVLQKQVTWRFEKKPEFVVALTQLVVKAPIFIPDSRFCDPQESRHAICNRRRDPLCVIKNPARRGWER
jgi:hypothetical protein